MATDPAPDAALAADLAALARATRDVYERNAERFDADRSRALHERVWLDRFRALLPPGAALLDAGCGAGAPIAAYLAQVGHPVTGVDFAAAMLAIARRRFPGGDWRCADLRTLALPERFAGIVAWGDRVYHASLAPAEYEARLAGLGLAIVRFVPEDPACGGRSVLLAAATA